MSSIIKSTMHNAMAEGIYNEIISKTAKYHYFIGKTLVWDSNDPTDQPLNPVDSYQYELETRSKIVATKQLMPNDVSLVIPRYDWTSGQVYDKYDDKITDDFPSYSGATSLETSKFYVFTSDFNVYKCIDNNSNAPSINKPVGVDTSTQTYADGYKWKFMYNVPVSLRNKFLTTVFMPVTNALFNQFYSNGEITTVTIEKGGTGYTTASIVVTGNGYQEDNPYIISGITIANAGAGYTSTPAITISAPTVTIGAEVQATATATRTGGAITGTTITNAGFGYDEGATVSIAPPFTGTPFIQNNSQTNGQYVHYQDNYYLVVGTGVTGAVYPTHTSGTVASGSVSLTYSGRRASLVLQMTKTEAQITPILSGGSIIGYTINNAGVGYTYANLNVVGNGTGAELTANFSVGDINTVQSNVELLAVHGALESIIIEDQGSGYTSATVSITGDGTGATATASIAQGRIKSINITNKGSGYTSATVSITGDGTGAQLRGIIGPIGGHGKNAINELFAKSLMFYTTISNEKNQGLSISNDYRQTGILKQLSEYGTGYRFNKVNGSTCFKIVGVINPALYPIDSTIYNKTTNKPYYVVHVETNAILLQSVENEVPAVNDVLRNSAMDEFKVTGVTNPTIDKYSGDMLFIDNRSGFTPSESQSIIFRTVIGF